MSLEGGGASNHHRSVEIRKEGEDFMGSQRKGREINTNTLFLLKRRKGFMTILRNNGEERGGKDTLISTPAIRLHAREGKRGYFIDPGEEESSSERAFRPSYADRRRKKKERGLSY